METKFIFAIHFYKLVSSVLFLRSVTILTHHSKYAYPLQGFYSLHRHRYRFYLEPEDKYHYILHVGMGLEPTGRYKDYQI